MKRAVFKPFFFIILLSLFVFVLNSISVFATESRTSLSGTIYTFDDTGTYTIQLSSQQEQTSKSTTCGELSIRGELKTIQGNVNPSFNIKSNDFILSYEVSTDVLTREDGKNNVVDDLSKQVNERTLPTAIGKGAITVETSLDGKKWSLDKSFCNVFSDNLNLHDSLYVSSPIQLVNGCYYRVSIAYRTKKQLEDTTILFVNFDNYEYSKHLEVYEFYAENSNATEKGSTALDTPKKELGEKSKVRLDSGYSVPEQLRSDDPHYGWHLGTFFVNSYTRDDKDENGDPVFLKNVGDRVTLWFNLQQDIDKLNGNDTLSISEDNGGYDQRYEIPRTNFRRGALIIRYTDYQGVKHEPILYTNYLEACTKTGANTRVELFEEGDYEVSLDYEIKNSPRNVIGVEIVPTYSNYTITFRFSIRNGNCMVFPFDIVTGKELSDSEVTENGFKLDMAKSRYLTIDVKRKILKDGIEDTRFNRPAKDGEKYVDEGIYEFEVKNKYTGETTTKTIYVGEGSKL